MKLNKRPLAGAAVMAALSAGLLAAPPACAQEAEPGVQAGRMSRPNLEGTPFDGDFVAVGAGAALIPSYTGSDDYVVTPFPLILASYRGIRFTPRAAGLSIDFVPDPAQGPGLILGVTGRLRSERAVLIADEVVRGLGPLDRAIEVGPVVGVSFPRPLHQYDAISVSLASGWDIAGAHKGMVLEPTVQYFTPLSRAILASLSLSTEYREGKVQDYYFRVTPEQSLATGGLLPAFEPDGGGFTRVGGTLLLAYDLSGDLTDGGWGVFGVAGYSRVLGDAARSPFTSVRGSANQLLFGAGVGYVF